MNIHLQQVDRTYVIYQKRRLSYFAGCDYFRLASHPLIHKAVGDGLARYGLNVAASRATTGDHRIYSLLEQALAKFFDVPAAVLTSNGYMTDLLAAQALSGQFAVALLDEQAHRALWDAARFLDCNAVPFRHCDSADLKRKIELHRCTGKLLVMTDGIFSHNGELAPLAEYYQALPDNAMLFVDDAHGAGVLGRQGRGSVEHWQLPRERVIQTITMSKAFGVYGGAILTSEHIADDCRHAHLFVGNTPLPLPLVCAARQSLKLLQTVSLRQCLWDKVRQVKAGVQAAGYAIADNETPIFAVLPDSPEAAKRLRRSLLAHGIFPSFIHYPGGPTSGYFRFAISSEHSREQLAALIAALA